MSEQISRGRSEEKWWHESIRKVERPGGNQREIQGKRQKGGYKYKGARVKILNKGNIRSVIGLVRVGEGIKVIGLRNTY